MSFAPIMKPHNITEDQIKPRTFPCIARFNERVVILPTVGVNNRLDRVSSDVSRQVLSINRKLQVSGKRLLGSIKKRESERLFTAVG